MQNLVNYLKKYPLRLVLALALLGGLFLAGSWQGRLQAEKKHRVDKDHRILYYIDPMNPTHTSAEPGLAPCGMKMEPVYADGGMPSLDSALPPGAIKVSPEKQQMIGVRVGPVEKAPFSHLLRTLGRVAVDENRVYRLNAAVDGWIRAINNNFTGSVVKKDEHLASYYSPEFLAAEQAYLFALNALDRFQESGNETIGQIDLTRKNIQQYVDNLVKLGMSNLQLEEIRQTRRFTDIIQIRAPATSFILNRNISQGERFERGREWYRLADLNRVWVLADLFENEVQYVQPGAQVWVFYPIRKKTFQATVSDIPPQFDAASRTLKVRLEVDNPEFTLRPDMFVDVELPVNLPPSLNVPREAVLDCGLNKTVFVDLGQGIFEPRKVETGWRMGDRVEITGGLKPGERIVVSGNFLLDSESRMKLAAAGIFGAVGKDPVCDRNVDESRAKAAGLKKEYQDKTYYFCSEGCKDEFGKFPARYLGTSNLAATVQQKVSPGTVGRREHPDHD